jgi:signal transduction histidine kinase
LEIHFKDDGIGIPKEIQDKIFDYGFTTTDGSGLGLTHIKEIIEKTGGNIKLNTSNTAGADLIISFKK